MLTLAVKMAGEQLISPLQQLQGAQHVIHTVMMND